jgi:hypothetical protein
MDSRASLADEPAVRALQDAMRQELSDGAPSKSCSAELTTAIRELCNVARERGLRAEDVIIAFKSAWSSLPAAGSRMGDARRNDLLERAVTLCIRSYYSITD